MDESHAELGSAAGPLSSAADIFAIDDLDTIDVEVPEWRGSIRIRKLTAEEAITFGETVDGPARRSANVRLVIACAVDDHGKSLFTKEHLEPLKRKSMKAINLIATEALRFNGLLKEDEGRAKNA